MKRKVTAFAVVLCLAAGFPACTKKPATPQPSDRSRLAATYCHRSGLALEAVRDGAGALHRAGYLTPGQLAATTRLTQQTATIAIPVVNELSTFDFDAGNSQQIKQGIASALELVSQFALPADPAQRAAFVLIINLVRNALSAILPAEARKLAKANPIQVTVELASIIATYYAAETGRNSLTTPQVFQAALEAFNRVKATQ